MINLFHHTKILLIIQSSRYNQLKIAQKHLQSGVYIIISSSIKLNQVHLFIISLLCQFLIVCYVFSNYMTSVRTQRSLEAARPMLLHIQRIDLTFPKTTYAVYYKNYTSKDCNGFKNIDHLRQLFLPHQQLTFKIINFEQHSPPVFIDSHRFDIEDSRVVIEASLEGHKITLEGRVLNRAESREGVVDLCLTSKKGYDDFYKSRKKYKTLQNITKRIEFQIDHRVRLKTHDKEYRFDLQERKQEHYYLSLDTFSQPFTFLLEEITSIEDYSQADVIEETEVALNELVQLDYGYSVALTFSNLLQLNFLFDVVSNHNLSCSEMVSIRALQSSHPSHLLRIGNEHSINLDSCIKVKPLVQGKYYDCEWGYLNQNLNKIEGEQQVYQHLDKITKSTISYPHFLNQEILDLNNSTHLMFDLDGSLLQIPLVYVIQGLNFIENETSSLKFYIDSVQSSTPKELSSDYRIDHKRVYEMSLHSMLNISKINHILDRSGSDSFDLKIINEDTSFFIPFQRTVANRSEFKKEAKQLATKQEIHVVNGNTQYWLQMSGRNKEEVIVLSTSGILPFYLVQMTSSSSLSFQVIVGNSIQLQGSLLKQKIVGSGGRSFLHLMTALEGNARTGVSLSFSQVKQVNESAATFYNFKQRLSFAQPGQTQDVTYDVQIQFQKESKMKSLRTKLSPELQRQQSEGIFLRQFKGSSGVLCKQSRLSFTLKLRKMFYNDDLNYFDNQILASKSIAINPSSDTIKEGKALMLRIEDECYEGIEVGLYDSNVKKRIKYYLEIYAQKNQFLDHRDSSYKIKIPGILWTFINPTKSQPTASNYEIMSHMNRKKKNSDKQSFPNEYQQEIILDHYNYNDGMSVIKDQTDISYNKFIKCIKLRCDIVKDNIGWSPQSEWYFAVMTLSHTNFYFMVQRMFDPYEQKGRSQSNQSKRTVSREHSNRSDKHKIDPLAKTINNLDLFKLKQKKNELVAEGRQLTARYVKRQQKINEITKKIEDLEERARQKEKEEKEKKSRGKEVRKENTKMKQFYRSICQCGARHPQFNGYCENCLKKLKQRYEAFSKDYKQKCYQYETMIFQEYNQKQKIERMKRRVQGLKNQDIVVDTEDGSTAEFLMKNMQEKSLRKCIQDLKVELFDLDQQKGSLLENSNWQMKILQQKITQQDTEIYKFSQQYDSLKNQLSQLIKSIQTSD